MYNVLRQFVEREVSEVMLSPPNSLGFNLADELLTSVELSFSTRG